MRHKTRRELECEVCRVMVTIGPSTKGGRPISSKDRYLELVASGTRVRCEQCRKYVYTGTARKTKLPSEQELPALGLRRKIGRGAKHKGGLESLKLSRCGLPAKD